MKCWETARISSARSAPRQIATSLSAQSEVCRNKPLVELQLTALMARSRLSGRLPADRSYSSPLRKSLPSW
eukprot:768367-Hanusia_phi.AAC.2